MTIQTAANEDGILVLADSFYPGWDAYVDGKKAKIFKANHFFRAVPIPKGEHRIEFRYQPQSFKLGLIISLISLTCLVLVSLFLFLRQRKLGTTTVISPVQILQN